MGIHRPQSNYYEDCWGYIIQSTRYGGFKWHDPLTDSLIFFGRKSKTDNTIVVTNFFAERAYLKQILEHLLSVDSAPQVIIKNVDKDNISNFVALGFRSYTNAETWTNYAPFDDQSFPQILVDIKKLATLKGNAYRPLRKILNKNPLFTFRKYENTDRDKVLKIFKLKDEKAKRKHEDEMYYASHIMYPDANLTKFVVIDERTNDLIGFTAASDITPKTTALVAGIFKPNVRVASIWGIYQSMLAKYHEGFQKINLGGSEVKRTYNFVKHTFPPIEEIQKTHLVYNLTHEK